ncbi:MAG: divalent-cation tolerance protein CutA [Methanobacteriota archaeon]|nr:MAG: divalent-cation tolerance protein CutA [Euryarchaeota archaeon]
MKPIVVLCTAGSEDEAHRLADALVEENLAACVNVVPGVMSFYRWKGVINRDQEWLLIIKSTGEAYQALEKKIKTIHSYTVPEIIALPIISGSEDYLKWVGENVKP